MRIQKLISSWQGIADIEVTGLDCLEEDAQLARRTSQVLEELITNTIRYGLADSIHVELVKSSTNLQLELRHNGKGEILRRSGLGSLLLAQQSADGFSISAESGKTYVRVNLPLASTF